MMASAVPVRHANAAGGSGGGGGGNSTALTVALSTLGLFVITSLFLHAMLNRLHASDDTDALGGLFFEADKFSLLGAAAAAGGTDDDPLASGSATRRSRSRRRRRERGAAAAGGYGFGWNGGRAAGAGGPAALGQGENKRRMDGTVDLDKTYPQIRRDFDADHPPDDADRLREFARSVRTHTYQQVVSVDDGMPYDVDNCPPIPPENYPVAWPVLDVLGNWNPDDTHDPHSHRIYQGLCRFDAATEYDKALAYREAELPFVIRDDPVVLPTVERWNEPGYLTSILGKERPYRTDHSTTNKLMFYRTNPGDEVPEGWVEPTTVVDLTFPQWLERADNPNKEELDPDKPHWYFRLNAKSPARDRYLYDEMPFFKPTNPNFYMVDPTDARGINCRFGMRGNTAENHYDSSRNFIAVFGGERRYLLSHPDQCRKLALYPMGHPSARHSEVDWSHPDLAAFPQFRDARVNEVVLQAGDVLYLPTNWFHHIVSLDTNVQCNARSGITDHYSDAIKDCGFKAVPTMPRRRRNSPLA